MQHTPNRRLSGEDAAQGGLEVVENEPNEIYGVLEETLMKLVVAGMENQRLSNLLQKSRQETQSLSIQIRSQQQSHSSQTITEVHRRDLQSKDELIMHLQSQVSGLNTEISSVTQLRLQIHQLTE